jgi:predicted transcriptional regulator
MIFGNKRSEIEILAQILISAKNKVKKTNLLYSTNISYSNFIKYFNFLLEKEFLEEKEGNPSGKTYKTTEKGNNFLDCINTILRELR